MGSKTLFGIAAALIAFLLSRYIINSEHSKYRIVLTQSQIDTYIEEGILLLDEPLFAEKELSMITMEIEKQISERPDGIGPEYILGYHFNNSYLLKLASDPKILDVVEQLLNVSDVGIRYA